MLSVTRRAGAMISLLAPVLLCGAMPPLRAQEQGSSDTVAAIKKLENEQVKAMLGNPRHYIETYIADDFVGGTSFGRWETKADQLKDASNPQNKTNSMSISDLKVTAYPNTGIARYTLTYDDMMNGEHRSRTVLCTDTWIREHGAWKQAASHCSMKNEGK
jgi:hypothetical protein